MLILYKLLFFSRTHNGGEIATNTSLDVMGKYGLGHIFSFTPGCDQHSRLQAKPKPSSLQSQTSLHISSCRVQHFSSLHFDIFRYFDVQSPPS